uniref:Uncharacterized protein n=1 Tax=Romanomermis culicivorax TaxID=13658 RepID=A0A915HKK2_ROMCU
MVIPKKSMQHEKKFNGKAGEKNKQFTPTHWDEKIDGWVRGGDKWRKAMVASRAHCVSADFIIFVKLGIRPASTKWSDRWGPSTAVLL